MQNIRPCLLFDGKAEEAVSFYTSVFKDAKVLDIMRYGEAGPGEPGSVLLLTFELNGQEFVAVNGAGATFEFTPAISLFVACETQGEVDALWDGLLAGGTPLQCGWLTDKFGVSWQIVPKALGEMLADKDRAKSSRVMQAMLGMVKLDIAALERAYGQA